MIIAESAGMTDIGLKRKINEDSLYFDDGARLYIVADGMGGRRAGEVASRISVDTIRDYMLRFQNGGPTEELKDSDENLSKEANRLLSAIHLANRAVYRVAGTKSAYNGMGSTVSAVYLSRESLIAANVGDSPIYLVRNGAIDLLSTPHTLMAEQKSRFPDSRLPVGEKFRHVLTKAMGLEDDVEADVFEIQAFTGDRIVICSDGLSEKIAPKEILSFAENNTPESACARLTGLAISRGGDDNITVVTLLLKKVKGEKTRMRKLFSRLFGRS